MTASPWFRARRRDSASRLRRLLACLARHADWEEHTTWPTWERLMDATGWSRSTMSSWLAQLRHLGWLEHIESGSTPRFRPMALQEVTGNRAAVYRLRIPPPDHQTQPAAAPISDLTRTPTVPQKSSINRSPVVQTRASQIFHNRARHLQNQQPKDGPTGPRLDQKGPGFFDHRAPLGGAQQLAAATELRDRDFALARLSARWVRALARPFWLAGWTNTDLLRALREIPAIGGPIPADRCPAPQLRRPDGWVAHRLRRWLRPLTGAPLPPPHQWEHTRRQVAEHHGAAAAARLTYGATHLAAEDLPTTSWQRAEALELLLRRRAVELADTRAAIRPQEQISRNPQRHSALIRAQHQQRRTRTRTHTPPDNNPQPTPPHPTNTPPPETPAVTPYGERDRQTRHDTWKQALARARDTTGRSPSRWRNKSR